MAGEWASVVWKRLRSHLRGIAIAGGLFLVVLGLCEVLGWWTSLVQLAQDHLPQFNLPL
jgi:hypothetical protein